MIQVVDSGRPTSGKPDDLDVKGAAQYLGLSVHTLNRFRVTGGGPDYLKLGGSVRYDVADLQAWRNARRRRSTSQEAA